MIDKNKPPVLKHWIDVVFGVLAAFVLVGGLSKNQTAVIAAAILAIGWALTQMIHNAIVAAKALRDSKKDSSP